MKVLAISDKELPRWSDCEAVVDNKEATALQQFIYDYEPGDLADQWRRQLAAVVAEAATNPADGAGEGDVDASSADNYSNRSGNRSRRLRLLYPGAIPAADGHR